ncbi:TPA: fimbrial protein [Enterobacter asburiae]|nr:fimbrial protein [Enterobacter asburiae]HDR2372453.1 fimbrial protein [Enterobacter asburiae]
MMNVKDISLLIVSLILLSGLAWPYHALAKDVSLEVTGNVVSSGCKVSFNEQTMIGTFSGKDFPTVGSTSAFKAMSINLSACYSGLTSVYVKFSGIPDGDNPELLSITDTGTGKELATGLGVELLDNTGKTIPFNESTPQLFPLDEGFTTLSFLLRYKSTKYPVTSGEASAALYFDLTYP